MYMYVHYSNMHNTYVWGLGKCTDLCVCMCKHLSVCVDLVHSVQCDKIARKTERFQGKMKKVPQKTKTIDCREQYVEIYTCNYNRSLSTWTTQIS